MAADIRCGKKNSGLSGLFPSCFAASEIDKSINRAACLALTALGIEFSERPMLLFYIIFWSKVLYA